MSNVVLCGGPAALTLDTAMRSRPVRSSYGLEGSRVGHPVHKEEAYRNECRYVRQELYAMRAGAFGPKAIRKKKQWRKEICPDRRIEAAD